MNIGVLLNSNFWNIHCTIIYENSKSWNYVYRRCKCNEIKELS